MTNVHEILEKVRAAHQRLPANEAAVLFAAAVRLAAAQGATLRGRLVQIDDSGGLHLAPFDDAAPETEPGYLAPELLGAEAPRKSEPRVQVFAAGALGYELLTGHVPPGNPAELSGPLGDIVRLALAPDRRERFGDLSQLYDAVEGVQPRPPAEGERNIFAALRTRWTRAPLEKEAVARIIEKLGQLEAQVAQLSKAQGRLDASQRDALERIDRFESGQQRLQRPSQSVLGPALLSAVLAAAAVVGAGLAFGVISLPGRTAAGPREPPSVPSRETAAAPEEPVPAAANEPAPPAPPLARSDPAARPDPSARADAATTADPAGTAQPRDAAVAAEVDAGTAAALSQADAGQGPDGGAAAASSPPPAQAQTPPPAPPAVAAKRRRAPEVSQAAMLHAVAVSQVRRGESALEQNRPDEAVASFRAALENEATLPAAYRGLGMAYSMQGDDAQALQAYERYLRLAPGAADKADIRKSIAELKARGK